MNNFSDFAKEENLFEGNKINIEKVLNTDIIVLDFNIKKSKFKNGNYLKLQIKLNNEKRVIFTGSEVLSTQCKKYKNNFPFKCKIIKIDKYYTFK